MPVFALLLVMMLAEIAVIIAVGQAIGVLVTGAVFAALAWRGPLEWVTHAANQAGSYQPAQVRQSPRFR